MPGRCPSNIPGRGLVTHIIRLLSRTVNPAVNCGVKLNPFGHRYGDYLLSPKRLSSALVDFTSVFGMNRFAEAKRKTGGTPLV